ncbi:MAG: hypothetical protein SFZ03_02015 [Candidatus Melainabacteria bacterium]|nr:hypothetical protein [Candidatus Melainabacteria bacterium]
MKPIIHFFSQFSGTQPWKKIVQGLGKGDALSTSEVLMTWLLPSVGIPAGRFLFGDSHADRFNLLLRDGFTYVTGALVFLLGKPLLEKILEVSRLVPNPKVRAFSAFTGALCSNIAFASLLAPRAPQLLCNAFSSRNVDTPNAPMSLSSAPQGVSFNSPGNRFSGSGSYFSTQALGSSGSWVTNTSGASTFDYTSFDRASVDDTAVARRAYETTPAQWLYPAKDSSNPASEKPFVQRSLLSVNRSAYPLFNTI